MIAFLAGVAVVLTIGVPAVVIMLRRTESRARDAERRARDSERLAELGSMTGGLAHEIKNPLSTIGLNAQLLREGLGDSALPDHERERLQRRLDSLAREVERLGDILNDFLQFAGRMRLDCQPRDLTRIVDELADFFHPQCDRAGVLLRTRIAEDAIIASVDETLLKQAILNLMINAVQAMNPDSGRADDTPATGELLLLVESDAAHARIHVTDTGPGIQLDKVDDILRPYVSGRRGGTGLGLPTTRRIVEEHGGQLHVRSETGQGSDFVIELPLGDTPPAIVEARSDE